MIRPEQFTHLHAHTCYSLKDGSIPIRTLVDRQIENGSNAVCCTDHGNMTAGWFLYDYIHNVAKLDGVKSLIGCELYLSLTRDELFDWLPRAKEDCPDKDERAAKRKLLGKKYHQIAIAKNKTGYQNLIKIHNEAWKNGFYFSPTTTPEIIFDNSDGIIVTTTCLASLWCQAILRGDVDYAEKEIYRWKEAFGDDFFVELQPTTSADQRLVNIELIRLAKRTNTPMVITNDVHYIDPEDHELHYTLLNLDRLKTGDTQKLWEFGVDDLYIKSLDDMKKSWRQHHKSEEFTESVFESCVHNVHSIIDRVETYSLESEPLLPDISQGDPMALLKSKCIKGFKEKVEKGSIPQDRIQEYKQRLIEELKIMGALRAEPYINICTHIVEHCKEVGIEVAPGRGSACSSLVLWLCGVTDIDPIRFSLIFSRFLNKSRRSKLVM